MSALRYCTIFILVFAPLLPALAQEDTPEWNSKVFMPDWESNCLPITQSGITHFYPGVPGTWSAEVYFSGVCLYGPGNMYKYPIAETFNFSTQDHGQTWSPGRAEPEAPTGLEIGAATTDGGITYWRIVDGVRGEEMLHPLSALPYPKVELNRTPFHLYADNWLIVANAYADPEGAPDVGDVWVSRSTDAGLTWCSSGPIFSGVLPDSPFHGAANPLGHVVLAAYSKTDPEGTVSTNHFAYSLQSNDGGLTWSPYQELLEFETSGFTLQAGSGGRFLMTLGGYGPAVPALLQSDDGGLTWATMPDPDIEGFREVLSLNHLYGAVWLMQYKKRVDAQFQTWTSLSYDNAQTWTDHAQPGCLAGNVMVNGGSVMLIAGTSACGMELTAESPEDAPVELPTCQSDGEGEGAGAEGQIEAEGSSEGLAPLEGEGVTDPEGAAEAMEEGAAGTDGEGEGLINPEGSTDGAADGEVPVEGEGTVDVEGSQEGPQEGEGAEPADGEGTGVTEGEGIVDIEGALDGEGTGPEGDGAGEPEGLAEGQPDGEGGAEAENVSPVHSADFVGHDGVVALVELLRVIQLFNSNGISCADDTEDGYAPGGEGTECAPHGSDYAPQDWMIGFSELLRLIQVYNSTGYWRCGESEDGYCISM